jgi:hypothetical protein
MDAPAMDISKKRQRAGRLGGRKRSERKTQANQINGRVGGLAKSGKKVAASRANGALGGRPTIAAADVRVLDAIFGAGSVEP